MKKAAIIWLILCVALAIGCAGNAAPAQVAEPTATDAVDASTAEPEDNATVEPDSSTEPAKRIEPLPATLNIDALDDCTFPASFTAKDVYLNDDGALVVHMTVYAHELFDMVDISLLATGDTIVIGGADVLVTTLDRSENGSVLINGGWDLDGYTLVTDEGTVFYSIGANDVSNYFAIGEATLPIDQEFRFIDGSDLDNPEKEIYPGDFLTDMETSDTVFTEFDTTVTVQGGFITNITRIYIP